MRKSKESPGYRGGLAAGGKLREEAAARKAEYDKNPNICKGCGGGIMSKPHEKLYCTKRNKYCTLECWHDQGLRDTNSETKRQRNTNGAFMAGGAYLLNVIKVTPRRCVKCNAYITFLKSSRKRCDDCTPHTVSILTKKELYTRQKTWQGARSTIRKDAERRCTADKRCLKCGYERFTEVCHIKAVADFSDESLVSKINHPNNLIRLCPNHHWEFDNGKLSIEGLV